MPARAYSHHYGTRIPIQSNLPKHTVRKTYFCPEGSWNDMATLTYSGGEGVVRTLFHLGGVCVSAYVCTCVCLSLWVCVMWVRGIWVGMSGCGPFTRNSRDELVCPEGVLERHGYPDLLWRGGLRPHAVPPGRCVCMLSSRALLLCVWRADFPFYVGQNHMQGGEASQTHGARQDYYSRVLLIWHTHFQTNARKKKVSTQARAHIHTQDTYDDRTNTLAHNTRTYADEFTFRTLSAFFGIYFLATCWTYGLLVPSGIFLPTLLMGAVYGRLVAMSLQQGMAGAPP